MLVGAAIAGATLVPTLLSADPQSAATATNANIEFSPMNLLRLPLVAVRYAAFGSFELPRFIGPDTSSRLAFLARFWWAAASARC